MIEFDAKIFVSIEFAGLADKDLSEVGVDSPVASFVGIGQRGTGDISSKACVIEFGLHGTKTGLNSSKTVSIGELSESHTIELIQTREVSDATFAVILSDSFAEFVYWEEVHDLGEDGSSRIHWPCLS